jgi:hypothetical protein
MGPLAVAACAGLVLLAARPGLPVALAIIAGSGVLCCYQLAANAEFVSAVPAGRRSQAFGIAQGGITLGQGLVMIAAGTAADHLSPEIVIAVGGALGALVGLLILQTGPHAYETALDAAFRVRGRAALPRVSGV